MNRVIFVPRVVAEKWIPAPNSALISIYDKEQEPLSAQDGWEDILRLRFHDADKPAENIELISPEQAQSVLAFVEKHAHREEILVHCQMGQSRSAAVALFVAKELDVPCYKESRPVTLLSWSQYNRKVYRTLEEAKYGGGSAFGDIEA